jgi:hypothetical protein
MVKCGAPAIVIRGGRLDLPCSTPTHDRDAANNHMHAIAPTSTLRKRSTMVLGSTYVRSTASPLHIKFLIKLLSAN